jgi:hypothetical protein
MTHKRTQSQVVRCPRCGFTYLEITSVTIETDVRGSGRFGAVRAQYKCEGCEGGTLEFDFDKGRTFIEGV